MSASAAGSDDHESVVLSALSASSSTAIARVIDGDAVRAAGKPAGDRLSGSDSDGP